MSRLSQQEIVLQSKADDLIHRVHRLAHVADFVAQMHDENWGNTAYASNVAECLKTVVLHLREEVERLDKHWVVMCDARASTAFGGAS